MDTLCFSCTATSLTIGASVLIVSGISALMPSLFMSAAFTAPTISINNVTSSRIIDFPFMLNHSHLFLVFIHYSCMNIEHYFFLSYDIRYCFYLYYRLYVF